MKSVVIWENGACSRDNHCSREAAEAVASSIEAEGMGGEGKVFPIVALVVEEGVKYIVQDSIGYWWAFNAKPKEILEGCWQSNGLEGKLIRTGIGQCTNRLFKC